MGLEMSKQYSTYSFDQGEPNFMKNKGSHKEI